MCDLKSKSSNFCTYQLPLPRVNDHSLFPLNCTRDSLCTYKPIHQLFSDKEREIYTVLCNLLFLHHSSKYMCSCLMSFKDHSMLLCLCILVF